MIEEDLKNKVGEVTAFMYRKVSVQDWPRVT